MQFNTISTNIDELTSSAVVVFITLEEFVKSTIDIINISVEVMTTLHKQPEIKETLGLHSLWMSLKVVIEVAVECLNKVNALYSHGRQKILFDDTRKGIESEKYALLKLKDFIDQLKFCFEQAKQLFGKWKKKYETMFKLISSTIESCDCEGQDARNKQITATAVGGTVAAAAIGTGLGAGVMLSVVPGAFTFGIGTVVGLSLTAAGAVTASTVIAGGTAVATHMIASRYEKLRNSLESLKSKIIGMNDHTDFMDRSLSQLKRTLEIIDQDLKDIDSTNDDSTESEKVILIKSINGLQMQFYKLSKNSTFWKNNLEKKKDGFQSSMVTNSCLLNNEN